MSADPKPDSAIPPENSKGAILQANTRRIDTIFAFEFLEVQAGMSGIISKKAISSFCVLLNVRGKILE
jgi:hypothetical protein